MNYFNPIAGVFNLSGKCRVSCFRHLDNACDYSEPYSMPWQAMVHLICNVFLSKLSTLVLCTNRMRWFWYVLYSDGKIAQVRKLYRRDNAGQRKLGIPSFLSVAWPTGVQLVFFFCSGVSRLFGAQGSPSSGSLLNL